jgi:hypothetical protein
MNNYRITYIHIHMNNINVPFLGNSAHEHPEPINTSNAPQITTPRPEHTRDAGHIMSQISTHCPKKLYWLTAKCYSFCLFLITALPMFILFVSHECSSIGYFISESLNCGGATNFSPISPVWSHLVLVIYYYALSKYCTMIQT